MDTLQAFLDTAWAEHADQSEAVARRLPGAVSLLRESAQVADLMHLAHHLLGQHLGDWPAGLALVQAVREQSALPLDEAALATLQRVAASLRLAGGLGDDRPQMAGSEGVRVTAMAAACATAADLPRARQLFDEAETACAALPDADAAVRALAASSNNVATHAMDMPGLRAEHRALMLHCAALSRRAWARAGSWLQVERAEYFLAKVHLAAGDAATARHHAAECERIVRENGADPFELFYAQEVLALAAAADGDAPALAAAQAGARAAFAQLAADQQPACSTTMQGITGLQARTLR